MKAPKWYREWCREALDELSDKQGELQKRYRLGSWPRFDYDLDAGTLTFSADGEPGVMAEIQVVGTIGARDWLWGWANAHWPPSSVVDIQRVRDFGAEHQIAELTSEHLEAPDLNVLGWQLTAVAARVLDAPGVYRAPSDHGGLFLLFRSVRFVT